MYCREPWNNLDVWVGGNVHCCCWIKTPVGNILEKSLTEIWNGYVIQDIRRSVTDGDFRYCFLCPLLPGPRGPLGPRPAKLPDTSRIPHLMLSYDRTCNLSCPSCRTHVLAGDELLPKETSLVHERILADIGIADMIGLAGCGEPFASPSYRALLKELPSRAPNAPIHLISNGLLLDADRWQELGPAARQIALLSISIDAATEATYEQNRREGSWSRLWANIEIVRARKRERPFQLQTNFVVQANNFREIIPFTELAFAHDFSEIHFSFIDNWGQIATETYLGQAVHLPSHPDHPELLKILRGARLRDPRILLPNLAAE